MSLLVIFVIYLVINTLILYLITDKILILDATSTVLLKAFIITLSVSLYNQYIPPLLGEPSGFHAEMFTRIFKYLLLIPPYLFIKYIYGMNWQNFFYFLIADFSLKWLSTVIIIAPLLKLIYQN
jgi:hypothetical protein